MARRMAQEFYHTQQESLMMDNGKIIKNMAEAKLGILKEMCTMVNGIKMFIMDTVSIFGRMGISIKDIGKEEKDTGKLL